MAVSKGLRWFAIFCGMIVAAMVAVALYLGPNVLSFLFHDERDTAPFVMIDFVEFDLPVARIREIAKIKTIEERYAAFRKLKEAKLTGGKAKLMIGCLFVHDFLLVNS